MSDLLGGVDDLHRSVDANAAYLRDCLRCGAVTGAVKAQIKLKELDIVLAVEFDEA